MSVLQALTPMTVECQERIFAASGTIMKGFWGVRSKGRKRPKNEKLRRQELNDKRSETETTEFVKLLEKDKDYTISELMSVSKLTRFKSTKLIEIAVNVNIAVDVSSRKIKKYRLNS